MAALIIQANPDGSVSIAAPAQIPPELMADAEQVASLEEAAQVLQDVLGAEQTGQQPAAGEGDMGPEGQLPPKVAGTPEDMDAGMEQGFRNVRGAPR